MKPKVSDTTLGALLPALQGDHGRAARSKSGARLECRARREGAPRARPARVRPPGTYGRGVAR